MLLAHLRGLLQPTYSQGVRSVFAEHMVLVALEAEIAADMEKHMMLMEAAFAPLMNTSGAQNLYSSLKGGFANVLDRAMLDFSRTPQRALARSAGFVSLFHHLCATGFFDELNAAAEKVLQDQNAQRH